MRRLYLFRFNLQFLFLLILVSAVAVYRWGRLEYGTVDGTITVNGESVGVVTVIFHSSKGATSTIDTDSNGRFQVRLATGAYSIGIESSALGTEQYSTPTSSGIDLVVAEGANDLRVDLPPSLSGSK